MQKPLRWECALLFGGTQWETMWLGHRKQAARLWDVRLESAMDWVFVLLPKFLHWNLMPNVINLGGGALQSWSGHRRGTLRNGISALTKKTPESSLYSCHLRTCEGIVRRCPVYEPGSGPSLDWINWHLDLELPDFKNCENCIIFKPPSLLYSVIAAWTN